MVYDHLLYKEGRSTNLRQQPLSKQFHYTQAPNSLHLSSILHPPPNSFIPQRPSTKFHPFLHCPSSLSTFNHQFHGIYIHWSCVRALFDERLNHWWGVRWMKATGASSSLRGSYLVLIVQFIYEGIYWLPVLSVFPNLEASNSNMISRIPVRIRTKKAVTKTGSQESQRIQLTQNRVTRTRIRFAQRITLSRKTVRDRNVGEREPVLSKTATPHMRASHHHR